MSVLSVLYTLIIHPLELLFEVVFTTADRITGNAGLSIVSLSITFNLLVLPLYKRADELQAEERDIQAKMAYRIKRTKSTFKGDERFMMIQEYYRINHYKPVYALRSSLSLLLQIPFFIAAYRLLSGMQSLHGTPFLFISDLGKEDSTFMIGSFPVNILPLVMTLINVVSGMIYTKGHPLKSKIQVYGLAAVFLVLLYHSPSGLVFYWLLNNVFSLVKNILSRLNNSKRIFSASLLSALPLVSKIRNRPLKSSDVKNSKVFLAGSVLMALITGLLIPATVINSSAEEFINVINPSDPVMYVISSMLLSFGSWVFWGGVLHFFMSDRLKAAAGCLIWMICGISVTDYLLFGTNLGNLSSTLQYDDLPVFGLSEYLINLLAVTLMAAALYFVFLKYRKLVLPVLIAGILTVSGIGLYNAVNIRRSYRDYQERTEQAEMPVIPLSRNGQNVVVLMLDRSVGDLVPYIMEEKPELKEKFDGFTYYPNTISFGVHTNTGAPALYGGYEYTPENMNRRSNELLEQKHNEALTVMPALFGNSGYEVTIIDPPYAGYKVIPDLSIYDEYPDFNCYLTDGRFSIDGTVTEDASERVDKIRNRNFFCYSLMKISPVILQEFIYDGGIYNAPGKTVLTIDGSYETDALVQHTYGLTKSIGYDLEFLESYAVIDNMPEITEISDDPGNTFLMMASKATHSPCLLQEPDYIPSYNVDNTAFDINMTERYTINGNTLNMNSTSQITHYHVNIATFLKLGEWFDYLRENGVYDNTRIILVADHAYQSGFLNVTCNRNDMTGFLPLLMVKDFNAKGFAVCDDFMTNADTPSLAVSGLIENPVNPFTGNPIDSHQKQGPQMVFLSDKYVVSKNNGYTYLMDSWYAVDGDPHVSANWKYKGEK